jgi:hypothetical protein
MNLAEVVGEIIEGVESTANGGIRTNITKEMLKLL